MGAVVSMALTVITRPGFGIQGGQENIVVDFVRSGRAVGISFSIVTRSSNVVMV